MNLARQLRRASSSVALNISGGSGSNGGTRRERYRNALGSARETGACLDVAMACGDVGEDDAALLDRLDKVRAVLAWISTAQDRPNVCLPRQRAWRGPGGYSA